MAGEIVIDSARKARVQGFYNDLADTYDHSRYSSKVQLKTDRTAKAAVLELLDGRPIKRKRVLDCGCGTGRFSLFFTDLGAEVTGIDSSPRMLEQARAKVSKARFELSDIFNFQFRDKFDIIVSSQVLTHLHAYAEPLAGMERALKSDGVILIDIRNAISPRNFWAQIRLKLLRGHSIRDYDPDFATIWELRQICSRLG
ncbi:MAG: class I SAM-dependent DNA methyltransferase, partial [Gammaproteobacteria bacterium]